MSDEYAPVAIEPIAGGYAVIRPDIAPGVAGRILYWSARERAARRALKIFLRKCVLCGGAA